VGRNRTRDDQQPWDVSGPATRVLLASPVAHVLPAIGRTAAHLGLAVQTAAGLLEIEDQPGRRGIDRLFHRLARDLTAGETEAVRIAVDPPEGGAERTTALLSARTLAVELGRRGITAEIGVLAEAEFWSAYQPIVSLADRSIVGHEALLRADVDGCEIGGADLFFVAETAGWLDRVDRIGRESAIAGAAPWLDTGDLYVNFSPAAIYRPQVCLAGTERMAHDCGIAPGRLVFEVVESHAITDRGHLVSVLEHFRSLGCRIALDDVGAGWSSRSLLAAVRPDVVKLNRGLVQGLPDDGVRTVIRAVVDLAASLGAVVVAQGVETELLAEQVTELGADLGQGWLFGRPERPRRPEPEPEAGWRRVEVRPRRQPMFQPVSTGRSCSVPSSP
jgi:EAL domain-containing protein (putative c-di-GMP-specific phosphodiesterase class I)